MRGAKRLGMLGLPNEGSRTRRASTYRTDRWRCGICARRDDARTERRYALCGRGGLEAQQLAEAAHQRGPAVRARRRRPAGPGTPRPTPCRRCRAGGRSRTRLLSSPRQIRIARALESMAMSRQFSGRSSTTTSSSSALAMRPREVETTKRDGQLEPMTAQPPLALYLHDVARARGPAGQEDDLPPARARRLRDPRDDAGLGLVERFPEVRWCSSPRPTAAAAGAA